MLAIPSPDVLMNLFASAAQAMGLLALCLGGGWFARRQNSAPGRSAPTARWPLAVSTLLLLGVSAAFLLYHLAVVDGENRRLRTNLVRSSTEAGKKVGDVSLKTLGYSDQLKNPRGMTTDALYRAWFVEHRELNLIDVREPEEIEVGAIDGSWARRYPDLQRDRKDLIVPGKETVLLCESGNRSSELSEYFLGEGITTKFMVGGYEKWVAEGRPIAGADASERSDLRAIPDYPNKEILLTTEEVERLYRDENVLFVDVRYPGDFELGHLPGAVDVPLRKLTSDETNAALATLPSRPIVAPCYDKRSSFYALILGLRLSRMGYDFRGRYTVPHEFSLPPKESEWVASFNADRAERTLFGTMRRSLRTGVQWLENRTGSLVLAIVLAALALRLLLLPLSWKAERDGIVQRRIKPQLLELRTRLKGDPTRLQRATFTLFRSQRLTPVRNLFGTLAVLVTFTMLFTVVDRLSVASTAVLWWAPLNTPDPRFVWPGIATALLAAIVLLQVRDRPVGRWFGLLFVIGIGWLIATCCTGVQLYLAVSFAALLVQNVAVRRRLREPVPLRAMPDGLVPLAAAAGRPEFGGKASRLGELVRAGYDVPPGFVVPHGVEPAAPELDRAFSRLGARHVAVRSSAQGEDGSEQSFAGEFRTVLEVDRSGLAAAIATVRASYRGRAGAVVVQAMVPAKHAGVMFTEDPAHSGCMLVEAVEGLGEGLVSGTATPHEYRTGRVSGELRSGSQPAFDLRRLTAIGLELEKLFGSPQDVEWASAGGRILLLQSRNVTRRVGQGDGPVAVREAERARLLALTADAAATEKVFAASDYAALLPTPSTFSLALMQAIWAPGGSVDLACRRLGVRYQAAENGQPYLQSVFGRCYVDLREAAGRVHSTAAAGFKLGLRSPQLERDLVDGFLPAHRRAARMRDAIDLARLDAAELHELCDETVQRFVTETYVECEVTNLAAEAYFAAARRRLDQHGLDASAILGQGMHTVVQAAFAELAGSGSQQTRVARFLTLFGHRAAHDFELAEPRFCEAHELVAAMAGLENSAHAAPAAHATQELPPLHGKLLRADTSRARRFQELKEEAKHAAAHDLWFLRRILLEIGRRHALGDLVFQLTPGEIQRLLAPTFAAGAALLAQQRLREAEWLRNVSVPDELTRAQLESIGEQRALPAMAPVGLRGTRVAGDHEVIGRVRVVHSPSELTKLDAGEILVVRHTDPCWLPAFRIAGGLVSEVGGWLSHAAIQAREHNLPAIVGLPEATRRLRDGQSVRLLRDGSIECLEDQEQP